MPLPIFLQDPAVAKIAGPLDYAAQVVATKAGPNWTGHAVLFLQRLEARGAKSPEQFTQFLKSLHHILSRRLETGRWS